MNSPGFILTSKLFFFFLNIYLFIYLVALGLSCSLQAPYLWLAGSTVAACQLLSCGMHVGSSFLTRDQTQAPCIGSVEPYPLHHQGSPSPLSFLY